MLKLIIQSIVALTFQLNASELVETNEQNTASLSATLQNVSLTETTSQPLSLSESIVSSGAISEEIPHVVSEYATMDTVFERVVTLGDMCLAKGQINQYFNPLGLQYNTKSKHADPFDWIVISDYEKFSLALSNNLEDIFDEDDFIIFKKSGKEQGILNTKYNMHWVHIFENLPHDELIGIKMGEEVTLENFKLNFSYFKKKFDYLKEKFMSAQTKKTLYVVANTFNNIDTMEILFKIRDALTMIRKGNKNFVLLFTSSIQSNDSYENIVIRHAPNVLPFPNWYVNARIWKEILDQFKFTADIWD